LENPNLYFDLSEEAFRPRCWRCCREGAGLTESARGWRACLEAWDQFWFTPAQPHTCWRIIRILGGGMLFYTHLVWAWDLDAFLGPRQLGHRPTWRGN
jgi:hypothetical protein